uniref:(northern house mosquito) hypothetical protein n=1 Tax=Culex pipiens TaxID=7175 RepID=A0A8D8G6Q6_CULPI
MAVRCSLIRSSAPPSFLQSATAVARLAALGLNDARNVRRPGVDVPEAAVHVVVVRVVLVLAVVEILVQLRVVLALERGGLVEPGLAEASRLPTSVQVGLPLQRGVPLAEHSVGLAGGGGCGGRLVRHAVPFRLGAFD